MVLHNAGNVILGQAVIVGNVRKAEMKIFRPAHVNKQ
jgi:hypothetical protein